VVPPKAPSIPFSGRLTRDGLLDAYWVEDESASPAPKYYRPDAARGAKRASAPWKNRSGVRFADKNRNGSDQRPRRGGKGKRKERPVILSETGESRVNGYLFVLERFARQPFCRARHGPRLPFREEIDSHLPRGASPPGRGPRPDGNARCSRAGILSEASARPCASPKSLFARTNLGTKPSRRGGLPGGPQRANLARGDVHGHRASLWGSHCFIGTWSAAPLSIVAVALKADFFPTNVGFWVDNRPEYQDFSPGASGGPKFPRADRPAMVVGGYWIIPIGPGCGGPRD